jgi:ABC-type sugar transport system ATPase subunit
MMNVAAVHDGLTVEGMAKSYGATQALSGVSLTVRAGEARAVLGENGAGKSTLVKIIAGAIPAGDYEGTISLDGQKVRFRSVREAEEVGIYLVPQELAIVPGLSVAENIFLNREPRSGIFTSRKKMLAQAMSLAREMKLGLDHIDLTAPMAALTQAEQQMVSILHALAGGLKVLILDEPTSRLSATETDVLFERIDALRASGVAVLYISHRMSEIGRVAQSITVLRDGSVAGHFDRDGTDGGQPFNEREVVRAMIGRALGNIYPARPARPPAAPALEISDLTVADPATRRPLVRNASLRIGEGEIVAVFGVVGSGAEVLAQSIFGLYGKPATGTVRIRGDEVSLSSASAAVRKGIGYVGGTPSEGAVGTMSIAENLMLPSLSRFTTGPVRFLSTARIMQQAVELRQRLSVRSLSAQQPAGDLSGGNQQKVALGRWITAHPAILLLADPTRGIDIGARAEIYKIIHGLTEQGLGVLLVSSDLDEVLGLGDEIHVMRRGRLVARWQRADATAQDVLGAAVAG